jgi:hypothetical protein
VIISLTLWLIAMGVATGYTVPAMRRAAHMVEQGVLTSTDENAGGPATAAELGVKERLDNIAGRVVGSAALVLVAFVLITILMTARPFGT